MKNHKYLFLLLLIPIFCAILFFIPSRDTHADFGDFSSGSDYGGGSSSSSHSSSSYSSGSSSSSRSSYSNGSHNSSSNSSSNYEGLAALIGWGATFWIGFFVGKNSSKKATKSSLYVEQTTAPTLRPISEYSHIDADFNESAFKEKISNLYVQFQNAWQAKNLETLRPYLTDTTFAQYERQLNHYREEGRTNRIEKIAVLSVELKGWRQENNKDEIVATVKTRIVDYVVDEKTGKIVEGSDKVDKFMEYEWTLERSSSVHTYAQEGTTEQRCPNCGGILNINQTAKCPYCRRVVTTDKFNWLVSTIKGISQRTGK